MTTIVLVIISVFIFGAFVFIALYLQHQINNRKIIKSNTKLRTVDPAPFLERAKEREARIVSIHPREVSGTDPNERIVKFRLAVKEDGDRFITHTVKWKIPNFILADFRQGKTIHVKVCDDYVFPEIEGALLVTELTESMN